MVIPYGFYCHWWEKNSKILFQNFYELFFQIKIKKFIFYFPKLGWILKIILEIDKKKNSFFFLKLGRFLKQNSGT